MVIMFSNKTLEYFFSLQKLTEWLLMISNKTSLFVTRCARVNLGCIGTVWILNSETRFGSLFLQNKNMKSISHKTPVNQFDESFSSSIRLKVGMILMDCSGTPACSLV